MLSVVPLAYAADGEAKRESVFLDIQATLLYDDMATSESCFKLKAYMLNMSQERFSVVAGYNYCIMRFQKYKS